MPRSRSSPQAIYLVIALRNAGSGIAVLHGWYFYPGTADHRRSTRTFDDFRRLTRDIYVPAGDSGFWQGAFRDPNEPVFAIARRCRHRGATGDHRPPLRRPRGWPANDQPVRADGDAEWLVAGGRRAPLEPRPAEPSLAESHAEAGAPRSQRVARSPKRPPVLLPGVGLGVDVLPRVRKSANASTRMTPALVPSSNSDCVMVGVPAGCRSRRRRVRRVETARMSRTAAMMPMTRNGRNGKPHPSRCVRTVRMMSTRMITTSTPSTALISACV